MLLFKNERIKFENVALQVSTQVAYTHLHRSRRSAQRQAAAVNLLRITSVSECKCICVLKTQSAHEMLEQFEADRNFFSFD